MLSLWRILVTALLMPTLAWAHLEVELRPEIELKYPTLRRGLLVYDHLSFSPSLSTNIRRIESPSHAGTRKHTRLFQLDVDPTTSILTYFPTRHLSFETAVAYFSGSELIRLFKEEIHHRRIRPWSVELVLGLGFHPIDSWGSSFRFHQDLVSHKGRNLELSTSIRALRVGTESQGLEILFWGNLGWGDKDHQKYLTGVATESLLSYYTAGLDIYGIGCLFFGMNLRTRVSVHGLLGDNRDAPLVKHHKDTVQFSWAIDRAFSFGL